MTSITIPSGHRALVLLAVLAGASTAFAGLTTPTFTNATGTRLSAAAATGASDTSEKAYGKGDLDDDGDIDIVVGRRLRIAFPASETAAAAAPNVLLMNENGVLTERTSTLAPALMTSRATRDVAVADFNNDGLLDVIVADGDSVPPMLLLNQGFRGSNWLGLAAAPAANLPAGFNIDAWSLAVGDLIGDGDQFPDVFIGVRTGTDRFLRNLGSIGGVWQGFADESAARLGPNATTSATRSAAAHDLNGDGDVDIIQDITSPTGALRVLNNSGGNFTSTPQSIITGAAYNFGLGDLNNDGRMDFYGVRNGVDQIRENLGPSGVGDTLSLAAAVNAPASTNGFGATCRAADLNFDGTTDFFVADLDQEFPDDCSRRLRILLNNGVGPGYLVDAYPAQQPWTPNGTSDIALLDLDNDGDLDMFLGFCTGQSVFMQDGSPPPDADINNDGVVNGVDLGILLSQFFGDGTADLNGDHIVNGVDLGILLVNWTF